MRNKLLRCRQCPLMESAPVIGPPVFSPILLLGQAPGIHEPRLGRPFAWTAGKTLFQWFQLHTQLDEYAIRSIIYFSAVCRCYPGRLPGQSGDRRPNPAEVQNCRAWWQAEMAMLKTELVIPVGRLAIDQFLPPLKLVDSIGQLHRTEGCAAEVLPLPHPSGASPWHRSEEGKRLIATSFALLKEHPAWGKARKLPI
ncbi:MAG: uracil-DNA glycosylase family protein [Verrucomicrobiales bacterium]